MYILRELSGKYLVSMLEYTENEAEALKTTLDKAKRLKKVMEHDSFLQFEIIYNTKND